MKELKILFLFHSYVKKWSVSGAEIKRSTRFLKKIEYWIPAFAGMTESSLRQLQRAMKRKTLPFQELKFVIKKNMLGNFM